MSHRYLKILPWYVNRTLAPAKARKVAAHLSRCATCQREIDMLTRLFSVQARTPPKRPVSQARLDAVLARVDRYEQQSERQPPRLQCVSMREKLSRLVLDWLPSRPALAAAACVAVVLAIVALPVLHSPVEEKPYRVLSSPPAVDALRIRLRFQSATSVDAVERLVRSRLSEHELSNAYRIEPRANGEYLVIFDEKPAIAALSGLVADWRGAPEVVDVAIDAE
jgi:hypothetical protein